jgi:hypothetical protein
MKKLVTLSSAALVSAALLAPGALAKGASEATITGPGLDGPLTLPGEGQVDGEVLMGIAEKAGFFAGVFGQSPDPLLESRPTGTLGPRYVVRYEMPGPNDELDELVQHVYPYASPSPVSYTKPGQRFWTTERTRGGWYVASTELQDLLVSAGLPENAPTGNEDDSSWPVAGMLGAAVAAVALVLASVLVLRRRPQTSTVTASRSAS